MSGFPPVPKRPKLEATEEEEEQADYGNRRGETAAAAEGDEEQTARQEQEEALVALIEHRTKEVEHLRNRITYYKSQLDQAEKKLEDSKIQLSRVCGRGTTATTKNDRIHGRESTAMTKVDIRNGVKVEKVDERSTSPVKTSQASLPNQSHNKLQLGEEGPKTSGSCEGLELESANPSRKEVQCSSKSHSQSRPLLVVPAADPSMSRSLKTKESGSKISNGSGPQPKTYASSNVNSNVKLKGDRASRASPEMEVTESQAKPSKRKLELKEHKPLVSMVRSSSSPIMIRCHTGSAMSSQHKRKLRSLILCPKNDQLFATSALDGVINLWQLQGRGSNANLLSTTECLSAKQRRWPEDMAWHPQGDSLFSVYSADGGDSQISILNLNKTKEGRVRFLEEKPHVKGIINSITFMPWDETCFVTGGSDHAVFLWTEKGEENSWKFKALHRGYHSSAVMGVAGMQKKLVLSVGADKKIFGFDIVSQKLEYKHQIESKCMSVLPNPCDFNLFMVQTGTVGRQLGLFDIRSRGSEIHAFGWEQSASDSQSALINQAWSPDGLYLTSGSADPVFHIFDIRYNAQKPSQSIRAHHKRVFKAAWHSSLPLIISISSDLNIGLHKIT